MTVLLYALALIGGPVPEVACGIVDARGRVECIDLSDGTTVSVPAEGSDMDPDGTGGAE